MQPLGEPRQPREAPPQAPPRAPPRALSPPPLALLRVLAERGGAGMSGPLCECLSLGMPQVPLSELSMLFGDPKGFLTS